MLEIACSISMQKPSNSVHLSTVEEHASMMKGSSWKESSLNDLLMTKVLQCSQQHEAFDWSTPLEQICVSPCKGHLWATNCRTVRKGSSSKKMKRTFTVAILLLSMWRIVKRAFTRRPCSSRSTCPVAPSIWLWKMVHLQNYTTSSLYTLAIASCQSAPPCHGLFTSSQ